MEIVSLSVFHITAKPYTLSPNFQTKVFLLDIFSFGLYFFLVIIVCLDILRNLDLLPLSFYAQELVNCIIYLSAFMTCNRVYKCF